MPHLKITNGQPEIYSIGQLRRDNPNTSFPKSPSAALLADWGVYPYTVQDQPTVDYLTQTLTPAALVQVNGTWTQGWEVSNLPANIQAGDLLLASVSSGSTRGGSTPYPEYPTFVEKYLDGFTGISFVQNFRQYSNSVPLYYSGVHARTIQYKIATSGDASSTISGFISRTTSQWVGVVIFVIRADVPVNSVVNYSFLNYGTTNTPVQRTINTTITTPISIPMFVLGSVDALSTVTTNPALSISQTASPQYHGYNYSGLWISSSNNSYIFSANDTGQFNTATFGSIDIT